ncbi:RNaseH domain-containing protein [Streptomyces sp. NPDC127084]|uniref:RNaseH domain-containing protein n=1 Tax=Streptomyces sp. NPDC127084 TaxID=3347133 RepID=UPI00366971A7
MTCDVLSQRATDDPLAGRILPFISSRRDIAFNLETCRSAQGTDANVCDFVDRDLAALTQRYPIIVFTEQRKGVWPGLSNERLGDPRIPGQQLIAQGWDISVVRIGTGQGTPQPSRRIEASSPRTRSNPSCPKRSSPAPTAAAPTANAPGPSTPAVLCPADNSPK